jgi:hypothetical protein
MIEIRVVDLLKGRHDLEHFRFSLFLREQTKLLPSPTRACKKKSPIIIKARDLEEKR